MKLAIVRPFKLLLITPIVTLTSLYVAITYGIMYLLITTFSFVYSGQYHFGEGIVGLSFLPAGIGMMIGVVTFGMISDAVVKKAQAQGIEHKPEIRIKPIFTIPCGVALPIGLGGDAVAVDVLDAELLDDDPEAIEPEPSCGDC